MVILRAILIYTFLCSSIIGFAQNYNNDKSLLKLIIKQKPNEKIAYVDKSIGWTNIEEEIKNHTVFKNVKGIDSISLSKTEKDTILNQVKNYNSYVWNYRLFDNSVRILYDSMFVYLNNEREKNSIILKGKSIDVQKYKLSKLYAFSKPIYLRNNTISLLFNTIIYYRGASNYQICFYKKEDGKWKEWILIASGAE
ncbi:MAG TPA: hypothetical protein PK431_16900 [Chitinophagales bacterium]|nr:hypothetical protein [Chitinophagales bacterium]